MIDFRILYWMAVGALAALLLLGPGWPWQGRETKPQAPSAAPKSDPEFLRRFGPPPSRTD